MRRLAACLALALAGCAGAGLEPAVPEAPDAVAERLAGLERRDGLFPLFVDRDEARVWALLPAPTEPGGVIAELLYVEGLATGLGSNPVGLDRGQLGDSRVVVLKRLGGRVLFEEPNLRYRASSDDPAELTAARESFASSVLWAGAIEEVAADGRLLVDLTGFAVRDAHGVAARLREMGEGEFELDPERSGLDPDACLAFPRNLEFEAVLTFAGRGAGSEVLATSPHHEAFTLRQHHSLILMPDPGYRPRAFDPRAGSFAIEYQDYGAALDEPLVRRWIVRHRLRATPEAPAELVYYVDRGIPEPVRSAVLDGARWWAEAFAAAGFPGAYRVELLPEGAHPLDVRYNVIQWVHRATRGWSYGGGVVDPRTGERLKGHVSLGSLRVRQDRVIFEGLLGADATGSGAGDDPIELALARIRQLSAHEVGHTLGLAHNFAASTYADRASVMDYPAPRLEPAADGSIDASSAYGVGVGAWDLHAIRYAYAELEPGEEAAGLAAIVAEGLERGWIILSDRDARPPGAALPEASLWDNGDDAAARLATELEVRGRALGRFGERNVRPGRPLAELEEALATLYFHHRYQAEAAVKAVGGVHYRYALRGDGQEPVHPLPAAVQRRALDALLAALDPAVLDIPEAALAVVHPRPLEDRPNRELFRGGAGPVLDPLAAAATAADLVVAGLTQRERAARLVDQARRDPGLPGLEEVLDGLVLEVFDEPSSPPRRVELARVVQQVVVSRLIALAGDAEASAAVRLRVEDVLVRVRAALGESAALPERSEIAHQAFLARQIDAHFQRLGPTLEPAPAAPEPPPGPPIGGALPAARMGCAFDDPGVGRR